MKKIIISIFVTIMLIGTVSATDGYFSFDTSGFFNKVSHITNPSGTVLNLTGDIKFGSDLICLNGGSYNFSATKFSGDVDFRNNSLSGIRTIQNQYNMNWGGGANPFKIHFGYPESPFLYGALLTIRPYTDSTGALILKQRSDTQWVNLMEVQDKDGNNINFALNYEGKLPTNLYVYKPDPQIVLQQNDGGRNFSLYAESNQFRIYDNIDSENQQYWDSNTEYTQLNGWQKIYNNDGSGQIALEVDQNRPWDGLKVSATNQNYINVEGGGVLASGKSFINIYDNNAQTTGNAGVNIRLDNAGTTIPALGLNYDGNSTVIEFKASNGGCPSGKYGLYTISGDLYWCKNGIGTQLN